MAADYTIKQTDFGVAIQTTITDSANSFDFTTVTAVKITMTLAGSTTPVINYVNVSSFDATHAAYLTASYTWTTGNTAAAGFYNLEWTCLVGSTIKKTFPSGGYNTVEITPRLA